MSPAIKTPHNSPAIRSGDEGEKLIIGNTNGISDLRVKVKNLHNYLSFFQIIFLFLFSVYFYPICVLFSRCFPFYISFFTIYTLLVLKLEIISQNNSLCKQKRPSVQKNTRDRRLNRLALLFKIFYSVHLFTLVDLSSFSLFSFAHFSLLSIVLVCSFRVDKWIDHHCY